MRIQIVSDLHIENYADYNWLIEEIIATKNKYKSDILAIAGDVGNYPKNLELIEKFGKYFSQVIFVWGNHDYYNNRGKLILETEKRFAKSDNIHWLQQNRIEIDGQGFIGATCWFPKRKDDQKYAHMMANKIYSESEGMSWIYSQHRLAKKFFKENMKDGDIVLTHHMPTYRCVSPKFSGSPLNRFFVSSMTKEIKKAKPSLWICGHTHDKFSVEQFETAIVANPFGYPSEIRLRGISELVLEW